MKAGRAFWYSLHAANVNLHYNLRISEGVIFLTVDMTLTM